MRKNTETLKPGKKKLPVWALVLTDVLLIGATLVVFALFHHVLPRAGNSNNTVIIGSEKETGESSESESGGDGSSAASWSDKFAQYFTDTVVSTDSTYSSPNLSITVEKKTMGSGDNLVTYYVADIYVADIECFQTCFASNTYGTGYRDSVLDMDLVSGALLAMNGDYYGNADSNAHGVVIRNGVLYRAENTDSDICVLYYDGTMATYSADEFDENEAITNGAWQAWTFGPSLLDESGAALTDYNTSSRLESENPRSGIGYYEPGHYCFVVVDGRDKGYSAGVAMQEFAEVFEELGCTTAYNLDGGKSSVMTYNDEVVNQPVEGGRTISDCLVIKEVE
jgi:exopolysaccharide biosynthesis protein